MNYANRNILSDDFHPTNVKKNINVSFRCLKRKDFVNLKSLPHLTPPTAGLYDPTSSL